MFDLRRRILAFGTIAALFLISASSAPAALVVDDFEGYTDLAPGSAISSSASSQPWLRFGAAIEGNLFITTHASYRINGVSARIEPKWSAGNNINIRRNWVTATDLSGYEGATVNVKSSNALTTASMKLSITDGAGTTWQSSTAQAVTGSVQNLTFSLSPADMVRTGGTASYADVLDGVTAIGFRFENAVNSATEIFSIDDFALTPIPEPATAGLLLVGGALVLARRRRAHA